MRKQAIKQCLLNGAFDQGTFIQDQKGMQNRFHRNILNANRICHLMTPTNTHCADNPWFLHKEAITVLK